MSIIFFLFFLLYTFTPTFQHKYLYFLLLTFSNQAHYFRFKGIIYSVMLSSLRGPGTGAGVCML